MPSYRRNYEGRYFFFTLVCAGRRPLFSQDAPRRLLSQAIRKTRIERPWETTAIVLLPDHLHMLWWLSGDDRDYSTRIASIKRRFTRAYLLAGGQEAAVPVGQRRKRCRGVWQRRFWEHTIRDARDFAMHLDYIHLNPVKHGLARLPRDWPYSSFHRYVAKGWYEADWVGRAELPGAAEYCFVE